jgi:hypothetical protein
VGYWPFNGNANDESGNGNHLLSTNVTYSTDRFGISNSTASFNGIELGGGSTMVSQGALFNIGQAEYTIGLWMKIADLNQITRCLFNTIPHTGIAIGYNDNNAPGYVVYDIGPANAFWTNLYLHGGTSGYNTSSWNYVVLKKSGTQYWLYINGNLDHTYNNPASTNYNYDVSFRISGISPDYQIFNGNIDDIHLFNRALTDQEISAMYNGVNSPVIAGCTNSTACNYNASATQDDGSCTFPAQTYLNCAGTCINDADNDGTCDELENPTLPSYLPSNGLVGYWPFNGNANDESGNGNHGTVNGATLTTDRNGNANSAYSFDGNGDYIHVTNNFFDNGSSGWSVSMWSKLDEIQNPNNGNSSHILFNTSPHNGTGISLNWGGSSKYAISLGNGAPATSWNTSIFNAQSIQDITTDSWKYVTLVKSGNGYSLYLDGIFDNSWIVNTSIVSYFYSMYFGACDPIASNEVLIGDIDDIAIYNRALTPEEITALYNGTTTGGGGGGNGGTAGTPAPSVPQGIPYQAMIRDNNGAALINTPVTVRFSLRQDAIDGTVEYQETHNLTTNAFGLVNTHFGSGTATQGNFANINWSNTTKFIQVEANTGAGYVEMGTQQMMSVPFALQSNKATMIKNAGLPVYADNAAALAGGLVAGEMYRTATGDLKIVY